MYERKVWVNRQSEHPSRRKLTPTGNDGEYDVSRSEGIIMEDGDAFDADTMNDLERRVAAGFTEMDPTGAGGGEVTVQPYSCTKTGKVYALKGTGAAGRCKIPASWAAGDSFTVNGAAVPAYCGADAVDGDTIVKGRWVLFFYDGTQLNFNGGGGLSTSKLALATATEGNVLAGNKFYAGSKTIKEGTLTLTGNVTADKMLEGYPLSVKAKWEPMQEGAGTPSPENIRPIKGLGSVTVTRCGENLLNFPQTTTWTQITKTLKFKFKAGTYYLCCGNVVHGGSSAPAIAFFNAASSNVATISIEQGMKKEIKLKDCQFVILYTNGYDYYGSAGVTATVEDLMLVASNEIPSVYTPYTGQTNTLTLPETVYGGEVDAVTGDGKETWKLATLDGNSTVTTYRENDDTDTYKGFAVYNAIAGVDIHNNAACSHFKRGLASSQGYYPNTFLAHENGTLYIRTEIPGITSVETFKAYIAAQYAAGTPVQVGYKLAEPVPFTATGAQALPALAGVNTVLTDANSMTVTGRADPIKRITDLEDATASQT